MEDWELKPARDLQMEASERRRSYRREDGLVESTVRLVWWSAVKTSLRLLHRFKVKGIEKLPKEPWFVIIANHSSHLDALILAAALPLKWRDRIFPIAAGDVFFTSPPIETFAAVALNAFPMWRKHCGPHAMAELRERLTGEPTIFILFPEGARSRDGGMLPFKAGLGMMIAGTPVPVVPCHIRGAFEAFPANSKRPRLKKVELTIGDPISFEKTENGREGWKQVAVDLEAAVSGLRDGGALGGAAPPP